MPRLADGVCGVALLLIARGASATDEQPALPPPGGPADGNQAAGRPKEDEPIVVAAGATATLRFELFVGQPLERGREFVAELPSYRRAIELDREQRWSEAAALYQEALLEAGSAARNLQNLTSAETWDRAAFKIDVERRRSLWLAHGERARSTGTANWTARSASSRRSPFPAGNRGTPAQRAAALERGRILRLKLMAVRAALGSVPAGVVSATLASLIAALAQSAGPPTGRLGADPGAPVSGSRPGGDPEVRLLLCAARAAAGDRSGARLELAHVSLEDRIQPTHALPLASCQAALGSGDDALASLAVAVYRLGPSSRFLPGQTRELQSWNDWDVIRADPRFELIFR